MFFAAIQQCNTKKKGNNRGCHFVSPDKIRHRTLSVLFFWHLSLTGASFVWMRNLKASIASDMRPNTKCLHGENSEPSTFACHLLTCWPEPWFALMSTESSSLKRQLNTALTEPDAGMQPHMPQSKNAGTHTHTVTKVDDNYWTAKCTSFLMEVAK